MFSEQFLHGGETLKKILLPSFKKINRFHFAKISWTNNAFIVHCSYLFMIFQWVLQEKLKKEPVVHSVHVKESYENLSILLGIHNWQIWSDFKIFTMILGQQCGHYLFYMWKSSLRQTLDKEKRPRRENLNPGRKIMFCPNLCPKIYFFHLWY